LSTGQKRITAKEDEDGQPLFKILFSLPFYPQTPEGEVGVKPPLSRPLSRVNVVEGRKIK